MDKSNLLLCWLLEGTKGGPTRAKLLSLLAKKPINANQLSLLSGFDYRTVDHHLTLLEKNLIVGTIGTGYGKAYYVAEDVCLSKDFKRIIGGGFNGENGKKARKA